MYLVVTSGLHAENVSGERSDPEGHDGNKASDSHAAARRAAVPESTGMLTRFVCKVFAPLLGLQAPARSVAHALQLRQAAGKDPYARKASTASATGQTPQSLHAVKHMAQQRRQRNKITVDTAIRNAKRSAITGILQI